MSKGDRQKTNNFPVVQLVERITVIGLIAQLDSATDF